jgi:hypothetical protein
MTITYVTADASIPPPVDKNRNARGQYKAAGGSYIGKLLAFMGDKYNRERTLHSWPHARVYANGDGGPLAIATRNVKMLEDVIRGLTRTTHEKDSEIAALRKRLRLANNKVAALNSQTPLDEMDEEPDAVEIEDEADEVTGYEQDAESSDE